MNKNFTSMITKLRLPLALVLLIVGAGFMPTGGDAAQSQTRKNARRKPAEKMVVPIDVSQDAPPHGCKGDACSFARVRFTYRSNSKVIISISVTNNGDSNMAFGLNVCNIMGTCSTRIRTDVPAGGTEVLDTNSLEMLGYKKLVVLFRPPQD